MQYIQSFLFSISDNQRWSFFTDQSLIIALGGCFWTEPVESNRKQDKSIEETKEDDT